jgi:hypothetical protein
MSEEKATPGGWLGEGNHRAPQSCGTQEPCRVTTTPWLRTRSWVASYRDMIIGKPKWRWFLQQIPEAGPGRPIPPPNQGMADTLEQAQAAFKKRYEEVSRER